MALTLRVVDQFPDLELPLGTSGLPVTQGVVRWFDLASGNGGIAAEGIADEIFSNFTAIPGQGYRTIRAGTPVRFELVENPTGPTARNIQPHPP